MEKITVAKFGGSTIGAYGIGIAEIVKRVQHLDRIKNGAACFLHLSPQLILASECIFQDNRL